VNERIRELIEQATHTAMWPGDPDAGELNAEKFAELIVRECAHIAWLNSTQDNISHTKIKQHFGVE
jgi:dephospho-CoA kinase